MKTMFLIISTIVAIVVIGLLARVQNAPRERPTSKNVQGVASIYPLAEFVQHVGGGHVEVISLTPPGTEPHDFNPTPQDRVTIEQAHFLVFVGAGFEPWLERIIPDLNAITLLEASQGIPLLPAIAGGEHDREEKNVFDPHILTDPVLAQQIVDTIAKTLITIDPANTAVYQENSTRYTEQLQHLDSEFADSLASCETREFITSHAAFAYLAKRYHLVQVPIAGLHEEEPSPERLAEIVNIIKAKNIRYIFLEAVTGNSTIVETIAKETDAMMLSIQPPEDVTQEDIQQGKTYIDLMQANLANLRLALGCH